VKKSRTLTAPAIALQIQGAEIHCPNYKEGKGEVNFLICPVLKRGRTRNVFRSVHLALQDALMPPDKFGTHAQSIFIASSFHSFCGLSFFFYFLLILGCAVTMTIGKSQATVRKHLNTCPYQIVACEDCKASMERRAMEAHEDGCPCAVLECEHVCTCEIGVNVYE
jgi:hypothetical protein